MVREYDVSRRVMGQLQGYAMLPKGYRKEEGPVCGRKEYNVKCEMEEIPVPTGRGGRSRQR